MRLATLLVVVLLVAGCSPAPNAVFAPTAAPRPTATVGAAPTAVATARPTPQSTSGTRAQPATGTSAQPKANTGPVDYKAIAQPLLLPLGGLITAVSAGTPTADYWLQQFNKAADTMVLPQIQGDNSTAAGQLQKAIAAVRASPNNLQALYDARSTLLAIS